MGLSQKQLSQFLEHTLGVFKRSVISDRQKLIQMQLRNTVKLVASLFSLCPVQASLSLWSPYLLFFLCKSIKLVTRVVFAHQQLGFSTVAADCKLLSMPPSSILEPGGLGDPSILTVSSKPPFPAPKHILGML